VQFLGKITALEGITLEIIFRIYEFFFRFMRVSDCDFRKIFPILKIVVKVVMVLCEKFFMMARQKFLVPGVIVEIFKYQNIKRQLWRIALYQLTPLPFSQR